LKKVNIALFSYRRPEQTSQAIARISNWTNLNKVYVSIDGLRSDASNDEKSWRNETISVAEKAAHLDSRVVPVVWDLNNGLTNHAIRIMRLLFESDYRLISLEEDNYIENAGLDFLAKYSEPQEKPSIVTAFSSQSHTDSDRNFRFTYFPEQWATSLTHEVFESFLEVWNDKFISRRIIQEHFKQIYPLNKIKRELVVERWFRIYNLSANNLSYGDALMAYSALRLDTPYIAPINSFVKDIGFENSRGMHPRVSAFLNEKHEFKTVFGGNPDVCIKCENSTNQVPGMGMKLVAKYIARRIL
jgi:hypothetical protein